MVPGKETNTVYFSEKLNSDDRFKNTCNTLCDLLEINGIKHDFLKATRDIWCRDYMPVQIEKGKFVQFRYEPSYLKEEIKLQSDPKEFCKANSIEPQFSKINLDGGNVVNWSDRAIITNRVFDENPEFASKAKLITEIEKLIEAEVIVIPQVKSDLTGHADGLVRFIDRDTLIGNAREEEFKYWTTRINRVLKENGLDYIDIPFLKHKAKKYPDHAIGCYVNYLEVQGLIVLPIFETENNKDREVLDIFKQVFPNRKIETINYNEIAVYGGLLNCSTWTILE